MYAHKTTDNGAVFNRDVTRQTRRVRDHVVVANGAVVSDVDISHQHISVTNACVFAFAGAFMNRHHFAQNVVVAEAEKAAFAFILGVLRFVTQNDIGP